MDGWEVGELLMSPFKSFEDLENHLTLLGKLETCQDGNLSLATSAISHHLWFAMRVILDKTVDMDQLKDPFVQCKGFAKLSLSGLD